MSDAADTSVSLQGRRRRLLFRLRRATRLLEQRERLQDVGLGLLAAALALSLPAAPPLHTGNEALLRLSGETVMTQGLVFPLGRGVMEVAPGKSVPLIAPKLAYNTKGGTQEVYDVPRETANFVDDFVVPRCRVVVGKEGLVRRRSYTFEG